MLAPVTESLPPEVQDVFTRFITTELTTIDGRGQPITWPVTPYYRAGGLCIDVTTGQGHAVYRVSNVTDLASSDGSFAQYRNDNRLTLFTSGSRWTASSRLVVSAALVGQPFPATPLKRTLDPEGLGLTGERDATAYTLVWLELLAVVALITVFAASSLTSA